MIFKIREDPLYLKCTHKKYYTFDTFRNIFLFIYYDAYVKFYTHTNTQFVLYIISCWYKYSQALSLLF